MTRFRVVIQPSATAEIDAAYEWISERNPDTAATWFLGLQEAILGLANLPERYPVASESSAFKDVIRILIYGQRSGRYRVYFTIRKDAVHVLHVRHGARDYLAPDQGE